MRAIATQKLVPKLDRIAAFKRVRSRPILPQGIEYNLADRLAGLTRQSARELRGFGVTDMNLIPHGCFLCAERQIRYKCALATASPQQDIRSGREQLPATRSAVAAGRSA